MRLKSFFSSLKRLLEPVKGYLRLQKEFFLNFFKVEYLANNNLQLGKSLFYTGHIGDAVMRLKIVLFLQQENAEAYYYLGRCYLFKDATERAKLQFEKCIECDKSFVKAKYFLSKINSPERVRQINKQLVTEIADFLADDYANTQKALGYRGDVIASSMVVNHQDKRASSINMLIDLGCMGGLAVRKIREKMLLQKVVGVDLSQKALAQLEKEVINDELLYTELVHGDIEEKLPMFKQQADLVLAINMLHYFRSIEDVFALMAQSLKNEGFVVGSFYSCNEPRWKFDTAKDRFLHSKSYIKEEAKRQGLQWLEGRDLGVYSELEESEACFFICQKTPSVDSAVVKKPQSDT